MMREFLISYFREKNIEFKEVGNQQFALELCPSCGKDNFHLYVGQENGLCNCKVCSWSGNFNQFRKLMGDAEIDLSAFENKQVVKKKEYRKLNYNIPLQYAARLWSIDEKFKDYLLNIRKLNKEVLEKFKIGSDGKNITIPLYENDILVNIQYRRDPSLDNDENSGARYTQETGCKAVLFNGDILKEPLKEIIITEGVFDALQLIQLGFRNVVSVPLGAGYFSKEWAEQMKDIVHVTIVFDSDMAGKDGAKNAANIIGVEKCKVVSLPKKEGRSKTDITNYFVEDNYTKTDFLELVKNAKPVRSVEADSIKHISEYSDELRKRLIDGEILGEKTGFDILDDMMGGLRKGRLVVVSGLTSSGKTSFSLCVALSLAKRCLPVFFFSLEMPPIDICKKLLMLESKLSNDKLKEIKDPSPELVKVDETLKQFSVIPEMPVYLYNGSGQVKYKILADCARIVKEEFGVNYIFVDHLHYFARSTSNVTAETSQVVRDLKQLAIQLDMTIILLAHLNREGRAKQKKGLYTPSLSDLRDSGATEQDADQVLFICRDSESDVKEEREKAFIKIAKNRDGYAGRSVSMKFDEGITAFIEEPLGVNYEQEQKEEEADMKKEVTIENLPF